MYSVRLFVLCVVLGGFSGRVSSADWQTWIEAEDYAAQTGSSVSVKPGSSVAPPPSASASTTQEKVVAFVKEQEPRLMLIVGVVIFFLLLIVFLVVIL